MIHTQQTKQTKQTKQQRKEWRKPLAATHGIQRFPRGDARPKKRLREKRERQHLSAVSQVKMISLLSAALLLLVLMQKPHLSAVARSIRRRCPAEPSFLGVSSWVWRLFW